VGKSGDKNDKTQLLSDSQVVEVRPSRPMVPTHAKPSGADKPYGQPPGDKNDRSVWKGLVVGADEFAPPAPPSRSRRWIVVAILGVAAAGAGTYVLWPKSAAAPATPDAAAKKPDAAPTPDAPPPPDARPDAAVDAALADAPSDSAPAVDAGVKPVIKKHGIKKKPVKKKTGPATSR
jgi:hypothetical protein